MHIVTIEQNGKTRVEELDNTDPNDSIATCILAFDPFQWQKKTSEQFIHAVSITGKAEDYNMPFDATLFLAN